MEAATIGGDISDLMKAYPQLTWDDYLYRYSLARIALMANDSTHMKYLEGKDKKKWEEYCERNSKALKQNESPLSVSEGGKKKKAPRQVLDTIPID